MALLLVALVSLAILNGLRRTARSEAGELPVLVQLAELPEIQLSRSDGAAITGRDLAGAPWVADFVFTRCVTSCPILTSRMQGVGGELVEGEDFRRVSISVDPAYDTPEVLSRYKETRGLPDAWWWLTGEPEAVLTLVREGFLLGVEENPGDPRDPILHSTRMVLVDGQNRVRGYYDGLEPKDLERLDADLERLAGR
jgi:protein SCO1/2